MSKFYLPNTGLLFETDNLKVLRFFEDGSAYIAIATHQEAIYSMEVYDKQDKDLLMALIALEMSESFDECSELAKNMNEKNIDLQEYNKQLLEKIYKQTEDDDKQEPIK